MYCIQNSFFSSRNWLTLPVVHKEIQICQHFAVWTLGLCTAEQFISNEHAQSKIYDFCFSDDIPYIVAERQQIKQSCEYYKACSCNEGEETVAIRR